MSQPRTWFIPVAKEQGPLDEHKHMLFTSNRRGGGLDFQNGNAIEITWEKPNQNFPELCFLKIKKSGAEVPLLKVPIWIEIVPAGNEIVY